MGVSGVGPRKLSSGKALGPGEGVIPPDDRWILVCD